MTFYALGLLITGIASTAGAVNLGVTIINMRAPGHVVLPACRCSCGWGSSSQFLLVFSLPIITVGLFELLFDRRWGTALLRSDARAATRSCGSTCSGCSGTPRSTS